MTDPFWSPLCDTVENSLILCKIVDTKKYYVFLGGLILLILLFNTSIKSKLTAHACQHSMTIFHEY